ncbi:MAG: fibronectin type III domain-containing protein, partial [Bdellovibrionales bacterium]|nr:fibronectin type III domain-containing protein [Bdellovibrionales bacterium]
AAQTNIYINKSYSTGNVVSNAGYVGGFVGDIIDASVYIRDTYSLGNVTTSGDRGGGYVGYFRTGEVFNAYSTGAVSVVGGNAGGFAGQSSPTVANNTYFNKDPGGDNLNAVNSRHKGKTLAELKQQNTFNGFDFNNIWEIDEGNNTPTLRIFKTGSIPEVLNLEVAGVSTNHVTLAWDHPQKGIENFKIAYKQGATASSDCDSNTADSDTIVDTGNTNNFKVISLSPGTEYSFRVCSATPYNYLSAGEFTSAITINIVLDGVCSDEGSTTACNADVDPGVTEDGLTEATAWVICNGAQLQDIQTNPACTANHFYKLGADIDLSAFTGNQFNMIQEFNGTFDGQTKSIYNFSYSNPGTNYVGLFNSINAGATVKNLNLVGVDINTTTFDYVGALSGDNQGTIDNVHVQGKIVASAYVGGLTGDNANSTAIIKNSSSDIYITPYDGGDYIGGLVGRLFNQANIDSSFSKGFIYDTSNNTTQYIGGLVGQVDGNNSDNTKITNSYSEVDIYVTDNQSDYVGGLVGQLYNRSVIEDSYATGDVFTQNLENGKCENYTTGGLVGDSNLRTRISRSYATGNVTAEQRGGGLVGRLFSNGTPAATIENSYATGDVVASCYANGGLVGEMGWSTSWGYTNIENSFATGNVYGNGWNGGLVGFMVWNLNGWGTIKKSYATGDVNCSYLYCGGFVGSMVYFGDIDNSYATGNVTSTSDHVGGFVGTMNDGAASNYYPEIRRAYSTGTVQGVGSASYIGGFTGRRYDSGASLLNRSSYYNISPGGENTSSDGGIGKTIDQMKKQTTFSDFDFENVWSIDEGNDTPKLRINPTDTLPEASGLAQWGIAPQSIGITWDKSEKIVTSFIVAYSTGTPDCSSGEDV